FIASGAFPIETHSLSVAVGDFNGDGVPDLAAANSGSPQQPGTTISVLLGNRDGTFRAALTFAAGSGPYSVALGDFNGDGRPDLAVANYGSLQQPGTTISVLLGNGDGTFRAATTNTVDRNPSFVVVGDFNGDGKPDLAAANYGSYKVSVLLRNGDGTFQPAQTFASGTNPYSVAVGDFNGDGKADLAAARRSSDLLSVLLGNGDGTFRAVQTLTTGSSPQTVAVGDFNGDGKPDLAVANYDAN